MNTEDLRSRYVQVDGVPWTPTEHAGIEMKILFQEPSSGLLTALVRVAPGASLPLHEHTAIEQSYVIEGSMIDDDGEVTAGNFVWRPAGSRHSVRSPNGALVLAFFQKPNRFLEADA